MMCRTRSIYYFEKLSGNTLDTNITVRTGATIAGESSCLIYRRMSHTEEVATNSVDYLGNACFPMWGRKDKRSQPITLKLNEGLTVKCATNVSVGSFDVFVIFGQE